MKKAGSGAGSSLSDRKQSFGEKAKGSSSIGSYRKKKLHGAAAHGLKEGVESSRYLQKEDGPDEQNVAEEVLESSKRTGEKVTGSAGKAIQKRQIKKKMVTSAHQKRVKGSGTMGRFLNGVENAVGKAGEDLAKAVAEHPIPVVGALVLGILILVVVVSLSSCSLLIGSSHGSAVTTSYTAQDTEILAADAYYGDLEEQLADRVDQIETDHPGYDEYRYDMDDISHDPYELASLLTVLYEEYTAGEVTGTLHGIFDAQYGIVLTETEETRTKLETKTRWEKKSRIEEREGVRLKWDEVNKKFILETYTYEVEVEYWEEVEYEEEVPYQYDVLHIFLTNRSVDTVVRELGLTEEQLQRYELLRGMKGNKSYLF